MVDVFFPFIDFVFFSYFLVNFILLDHLFVHFWLKPIPSIFFTFMIFEDDIFILGNIIWGNFLVGKFGTDFSWSFSAVFFHMTHRTTVLACSLTVRCGLIAFLDVIVWWVDLRFGLEWGYIDCLAFSFVILCIPRNFLNVFGCVLHLLKAFLMIYDLLKI